MNADRYILGMICFIMPIQIFAQQAHPDIDPALKPVIEIEEIRVDGSARTGDSFEILVRYTTHLDLPAAVSFRIPEHVSFPGRSADVRSIREDRRFLPAQTRTERF